MLRTAYCILHTAYCILHTAYCILHTAYCILYTVYCVLILVNRYTTYWPCLFCLCQWNIGPVFIMIVSARNRGPIFYIINRTIHGCMEIWLLFFYFSCWTAYLSCSFCSLVKYPVWHSAHPCIKIITKMTMTMTMTTTIVKVMMMMMMLISLLVMLIKMIHLFFLAVPWSIRLQ